MTRWLPPVYRAPAPVRRSLDPARPALRLLTIALLTALWTLTAIAIGWAIVL